MDGSATTAVVYQIRVRGWLAARWSEGLGGLAITVVGSSGGAPESILTGPIVDQAALRGILTRLWDLNLTVVSVNPLETPSPEEPRS